MGHRLCYSYSVEEAGMCSMSHRQARRRSRTRSTIHGMLASLLLFFALFFSFFLFPLSPLFSVRIRVVPVQPLHSTILVCAAPERHPGRLGRGRDRCANDSRPEALLGPLGYLSLPCQHWPAVAGVLPLSTRPRQAAGRPLHAPQLSTRR